MGLVKTRRLAAMQKQQKAKMASNSFSQKTIRKGGNGERGVSWTKKN